ncbi:AraC family transcriptional regulator [Chitinophaga sp. GbtcB8]|uniref:helix-turn-helix domain-containing protein n=1 Tax=Chitinophaga sp. GbtcB8 TaxID=2824753 RepID=UPI001C3105E4|nr:helix-turn-helix domain-containing protein [Chitinophaga sp. GbtcB8]
MNEQERTPPGISIIEGITVFNEKGINMEDYAPMINKPFRAETGGFFLVTSGAMRLQCNLETLTCTQGCMYFIIQGFIYTIEDISEDCNFTGITMDTDFLLKSGIHVTGSELFQMTASGISHQYNINNREVEMITTMLDILTAKLTNSDPLHFQKEVIQHQLMALLYETGSVFRKYNDFQSIKLNRKEDLTARFLDLLRLHVKSERSLQFYASRLSVTTGHLTKVIKQVIGKPAGELIDTAVITEAQILLSNPAVSVAQAAEELQFSDQSFFGKYFKKHTGLSPSTYKQTVKNGKNNLF